MRKAKAAVFMGAGTPFEVREFEVVSAPAGYGRCDLIASGVCGTDLHFCHGTLHIDPPTVIGHEFVGRLTDCDPEEARKYGLAVGDAVIADIAVPCGECLLCREGDDANCVRMQVTNGGDIEVSPYLYGGYAEVNFTPLSNLIKIPEPLDPAMVAAFACPGPTVVHAVHLAMQAGVRLSEKKVAVVQGLGPVGCFAILYLKRMGVEKVIAVAGGSRPERTALAKKLGADVVYSLREMGEDAVTAAIQAENGGLGADLCLEASGAPAAFVQGLQFLRNRGVYLIPGQYSASGGVEIQPQMLTFKALHLIGSSQYAMEDVRDYLDFLVQNPDIHEVIRALGTRYPVSEINTAIADADAGKNIKTLLVP